MSLLPQSTIIAAEIAAIDRETFSFLRAMARRSFDLANTPALQQAVMTALGSKAAEAVMTYAGIYQLLAASGQADGLSAPDTTVFQPQEDGTVVYVAPPELVSEEQPTPP